MNRVYIVLAAYAIFAVCFFGFIVWGVVELLDILRLAAT